mmetsp:Transcript_70440/g.204285  ORF Transcript_70440/g.204285 Transcript_70440/m.204285 type:complete len:250 (-) Transcript_70440:1193-1942(-)
MQQLRRFPNSGAPARCVPAAEQARQAEVKELGAGDAAGCDLDLDIRALHVAMHDRCVQAMQVGERGADVEQHAHKSDEFPPRRGRLEAAHEVVHAVAFDELKNHGELAAGRVDEGAMERDDTSMPDTAQQSQLVAQGGELPCAVPDGVPPWHLDRHGQPAEVAHDHDAEAPATTNHGGAQELKLSGPDEPMLAHADLHDVLQSRSHRSLPWSVPPGEQTLHIGEDMLGVGHGGSDGSAAALGGHRPALK